MYKPRLYTAGRIWPVAESENRMQLITAVIVSFAVASCANYIHVLTPAISKGDLLPWAAIRDPWQPLGGSRS